MGWTYDPKYADEYYDKWIKLGWAGTGKPFKGFVDPERLIIETTHVGRYEGRLFKAMLTWIRDFHDLINTQKVIRYIDDADVAILGAVIDIAIQHGANPRLRTIIKRCNANKEPQVLFKAGDQFGVFDKNQREFSRQEYVKWGLYCTMLEFYDHAMFNRKFVLKNNPLLALRALIGPAIRSEILFQLENKTRIHIRALAHKTGYAYSAVYNEVMNMVRNGFLTLESFGRVKVIVMKDSLLQYLVSMPVF